MTFKSASSTNMSYSGNNSMAPSDQFDPTTYSYELESQDDLSQNWAYSSMASNIPPYANEPSYLSSYEDYSEIQEGTYTNEATFLGNIDQNPYSQEYILSTPFNNEGYNLQQQLSLPQQQQIYNSSSLSPSYYQSPSSIPSRQPTPSKIPLPSSPTPSTTTTLSLTSSPTPSPSASPSVLASTFVSASRYPSPNLQAHKQHPFPQSSTSTTSYQSTPLLNSTIPTSIPYITTTLIPTEESRRRNRRREQNRKAQFIFRQKRKDEVQRLQLEVRQLKGLLASSGTAASTTTCAQTVPLGNGGFAARYY
ncbi:hypothetical protein LTR84_006764 [Exophiala bonariae]|uniref:BZIP domain-containing protein n=1 Tax=Exophiala bonariae TaxID=1690606 RepID=A0AAV9N067_9EURO|nr:hypothetical protein LTR84_006764 [Exophiala bonariae]